MAQPYQIVQGPLWSAMGTLYWFAVIGLLLVLAVLPGAIPMMLLDRSAGNLPLVALCLVPAGPALSAALFAVRDRDRAEDMTPARSFLRGYRLNAADVLKLWVPALTAGTIIAVGLANLGLAGVPEGYWVVLTLLGIMLAVWAGQAVVIASFFALRTRDVARLAIYYIARTPQVAIGVLGVLLVALALVHLTFDAALAAAGPVLVWLLWRACAPMTRHLEEHFTA